MIGPVSIGFVFPTFNIIKQIPFKVDKCTDIAKILWKFSLSYMSVLLVFFQHC